MTSTKKPSSLFQTEDKEDTLEESIPGVEHEEIEEEYEEEPEAFIPSFTVAPEEIPEDQQQAYTPPTEQQKQGTIEALYKKLGLNIKQAMSEPTQPMTAEKDKFVQTTSQLVAQVNTALMTWVLSIPGLEYGVLAPSEEESERIFKPILRIYARHSKIVGQISPDYNDAIEALTAISGYAHVSMQLLAEIRRDKAQNNGHLDTLKVRPSFTTNGHNGIREYPPTSEEYVTASEFTDTINTGNLTDDERRNYAKLQQLSAKEYATRARRSGRL